MQELILGVIEPEEGICEKWAKVKIRDAGNSKLKTKQTADVSFVYALAPNFNSNLSSFIIRPPTPLLVPLTSDLSERASDAAISTELGPFALWAHNIPSVSRPLSTPCVKHTTAVNLPAAASPRRNGRLQNHLSRRSRSIFSCFDALGDDAKDQGPATQTSGRLSPGTSAG